VPLEIGGMLLAVRPVRRRHRRRAGDVLALLFNKTRIGLLRAVADDPWPPFPSVAACRASGRWSGPWRVCRPGGRVALGRAPGRAVLAVAGGCSRPCRC
jgi:hypothetical protein